MVYMLPAMVLYMASKISWQKTQNWDVYSIPLQIWSSS